MGNNLKYQLEMDHIYYHSARNNYLNKKSNKLCFLFYFIFPQTHLILLNYVCNSNNLLPSFKCTNICSCNVTHQIIYLFLSSLFLFLAIVSIFTFLCYFSFHNICITYMLHCCRNLGVSKNERFIVEKKEIEIVIALVDWFNWMNPLNL